MTLNEYEKLTDTDKAFLKLEGRCPGCGCKLKDQTFHAHAEWCSEAPKFIWDDTQMDRGNIYITKTRRQGKSVFNNMLKEFNKMFRNKNENTNS